MTKAVRGARLFPAVAFAALALLLLKMAELALTPKATRGHSDFAQGFLKGFAANNLDPLVTGSTPAKKEKDKAEAPAKASEGEKSALPPAFAAGSAQDKPAPTPGEKALLERLGERREALEERQRELEARETLLKAADKKLGERINELKELEGKAKEAASREGPDKPDAGLKNLVTMYETMKPKDAARVFDKLDMAVLVPVVNGMAPRKMAEILAAMSPEAAGKLTVELARRSQKASAGPSAAPAALPVGELQAIEPKRP